MLSACFLVLTVDRGRDLEPVDETGVTKDVATRQLHWRRQHIAADSTLGIYGIYRRELGIYARHLGNYARHFLRKQLAIWKAVAGECIQGHIR